MQRSLCKSRTHDLTIASLTLNLYNIMLMSACNVMRYCEDVRLLACWLVCSLCSLSFFKNYKSNYYGIWLSMCAAFTVNFERSRSKFKVNCHNENLGWFVILVVARLWFKIFSSTLQCDTMYWTTRSILA